MMDRYTALSNEDYSRIFKLLDQHIVRCNGAAYGLRSLHAGGIIGVAEKLRGDLERFEQEVIRRAKAQHDEAVSLAECISKDVGVDRWHAAEASREGPLYPEK